jgi:lipid-A-disaccharide synthase
MTYPLYFLCAGEASGDLHGANLMKEMLKLQPNAKFVGVGGPKMRALGLDCLIPAEQLMVVGLVEVVKNFKRIKKIFDEVAQAIIDRKVDAFIPIDYPDFNLRLSKRVKSHGVKVIYYVCPQVWAWRKGRSKFIEKYVDVLLYIFPFEKNCFEPGKLQLEFIGHPLCDEIDLGEVKPLRAKGEGHLAIMPGSRYSELDHHLPAMREFFMEFHRRWPKVKMQIPCAQTLTLEDLESRIGVDVLEALKGCLEIAPPGSSEEVLGQADAALIASGTSTLQGVLSNVPLALFYRLHPLTFWVGKQLIKLPFVGLANLVAEKEVCREYLQEDMSVENLIGEAERLLWDEAARETMLRDYRDIHNSLGGPGASERAAQVVVEACT